MKKQIIYLVLGIFLISLASASAINITAGDSYSLDIGQVYSYYSISGNSTDIILNISQNDTIVTIQTDKYSLSDSFIITFFNEKDEVIQEHHGSSGRIRHFSDGEEPEDTTEIPSENPVEEIEVSSDNHEGTYYLEKIIIIISLIFVVSLILILIVIKGILPNKLRSLLALNRWIKGNK